MNEDPQVAALRRRVLRLEQAVEMLRPFAPWSSPEDSRAAVERAKDQIDRHSPGGMSFPQDIRSLAAAEQRLAASERLERLVAP